MTFLLDSVRVKVRFAILIILAICLATPALAKKPNPWAPRKQCLFGMPYLGHAVKPQQTGVIIDLFKMIYEPEDILFRHERLPYPRALEKAREGLVHFTLGIRDDRKGLLQTDTVLATYDLAVAYNHKVGFKDLTSLKNKRVAFLHGFGLDEYVPVEFKTQYVYDLSSAYHMLDRDHVQYVLGDSALLKDAMLDSHLPTGAFVIKELRTFFVRPMFAPTADGRLMRDIYERRMKKLIATGDFQDLMREYGLSEKSIQKVLDVNKQ